MKNCCVDLSDEKSGTLPILCVCMQPMPHVVQSCLLVPGHIIEYIIILLREFGASLIAQLIKNLPAMQETPVRFLGREDPLEKG